MSTRIGDGASLGDELARRLAASQEKIQRASVAELDGATFVPTLRQTLPTPIGLRLDQQDRKLGDADVVLPMYGTVQTVRGERMTIAVPTTGSVDLLGLRPTTSLWGKQVAGVIESRYLVMDGASVDCIVWTYDEAPQVDPEHFTASWDRDLGMVQTQIAYCNADIERFVTTWDREVQERVEARRHQLADQERRRRELGAA